MFIKIFLFYVGALWLAKLLPCEMVQQMCVDYCFIAPSLNNI